MPPSVAEQNAAFDVIHAEVINLINARAPFMFRGQMLTTFDGPEGRAFLVQAIHDGLVAAENVRAKQ